jgi:hypothetical protein
MNRKPDATPESVITDQLALVAQALADCFDKARSVGDDASGYTRQGEFASAATLLKASAKLGLALAKIKGEFNQNIRVQRGEGDGERQNSIGRHGPMKDRGGG